MDGLEHKVFNATFYSDGIRRSSGRILTNNRTYLNITSCDGYIFIKEIQQSGKRRMSIKEFLNGYKIKSDYIDKD